MSRRIKPVPLHAAGALAPIERRTLHEIAYAKLKKALLAGHFEPGRTITLRGLAEDLGTSVMPVREAVGRLVSERALELLPNRCLRIPTLSTEQARDLWELRIHLEGEAAGLAAAHVEAAELEQIRELRDRSHAHALAGDLHETLDANDEFQFAIYRASRSDFRIPLIESLRMRCAPHCTAAFRRLLLVRPPYLAETLALDDEIVTALERKDAERATRAKRQDLAGLRDWVDACAASEARPELPAPGAAPRAWATRRGARS